MKSIKVGDLVARKSYGCDVLFQVEKITHEPEIGIIYILKGVNMRIIADAAAGDLVLQNDEGVKGFERDNRAAVMKSMDRVTGFAAKRPKKKTMERFFLYRGEKPFGRAGRILHLDGDKGYLDMCIDAYEEMGLDAEGEYLPEKEQPLRVGALLRDFLPDVLVLTGHDSISRKRDIHDLGNYKNSGHYAAAVREARKFEPSYDDLIIFAGACQSHFEALMEAGANYASSPKRVLIHALDPVFVCGGIAHTGIDCIIPAEKLISGTITGLKGIGGLQTRGKYREGMPGTDGNIA